MATWTDEQGRAFQEADRELVRLLSGVADRAEERQLEATGYADWRRQHEQNTVIPATCCHCGGALLVYADGSTRAPELRRQHEQEA